MTHGHTSLDVNQPLIKQTESSGLGEDRDLARAGRRPETSPYTQHNITNVMTLILVIKRLPT